MTGPVGQHEQGAITRAVNAIGGPMTPEQEAAFIGVYHELDGVASRLLKDFPQASLSPMTLVHEALPRLLQKSGPWDNRAHFFGAAARAMRQVLIDHARRLKVRGKRMELIVEPEADGHEPTAVAVLELEEALSALEKASADACTVFVLRVYAGRTVPEVAAAVGASETRVKDLWKFSRAWLYTWGSERGMWG